MVETNVHDETAPRRPLVAALLSLGAPGLGQLYNGELNKGLWLFLASLFVGTPLVLLAELYAPLELTTPLLALGALLTFATWAGAIFDAWRQAGRRQAYARRDWQVSGLYAALLVGAMATFFLLAGAMREYEVESFVTPTRTMEPGLLGGDYFLVDKSYNCPRCKQAVRRGDVGVFVYPNDRTLHYVKRVIGLPGDRIVLKGRALFVNDQPLTQAQSATGDGLVVTEHWGDEAWRVEWKPNADVIDAEWAVPQGQVFLLGDNRDDSRDSRSFGAVPLSDLVGKARQVWFSMGEHGPRWDRIGQVIR